MSHSLMFDSVKENMKSLLKYSKIEYQNYKKTKKIIYLQQAGEKLFASLENYIQYVHKLQVGSFYELKNIVKEKSLRQLLYDARELHRFFYNAELERNKEDAEELYLSVLKRLQAREGRL